MGNQNGALNQEQRQNLINNNEREQNLIQNVQNRNNQNPPPNQNIQQNDEPVTIKKILSIKNPVFLQKQTLSLERNAIEKNIYHIKFNYDSTANFDCYINFNVSENKNKGIMPKEEEKTSENEYIPFYFPTDIFFNKRIVVKNLEKGRNKEFFEKEAFIDLEYFFNNIKKEESKDNSSYDVAIEFVPKIEKESSNKNEIVFVSLCKIKFENDGNHTIKVEHQRLRTHSLWIDLYDIFDDSLEKGICGICYEEPRNTVLLPCKHSCCCNGCAFAMKRACNPCPICKRQVDDLLVLGPDKKRGEFVPPELFEEQKMQEEKEESEKIEVKDLQKKEENNNNNQINEEQENLISNNAQEIKVEENENNI